MKKFIITFVSTFCYTGTFFFAPASFASFVWLALYIFVPGGAWLVHPIVVACTIPVAILVAHMAEHYFGHDAPRIVIDEVVGMQVTFIAMQPSYLLGAIGFVLFRVFDILKPFPADRAQKLSGGLGVVTDDVLAGAYGRLALLAITLLFYR